MPVIGELATVITARTAPFQAGMKRARTSAKGFQSTVAGLNKTMGGLLGMFGAFAGASIITSGIKEQFAAIDEIAKSAARIGTTTEEISRLQHAARITGASAEKLSAGLDVMSKRLGEAARGSGAAKAALDELGLSAADLIRMDPATAFKTISQAISEMETQAQKNAATANIFSRANQDLVNTLDLGAAGLREMAEESDRLGNTVDNKTVATIEAANDAVTRMTATFDAFKRQAAIGLAPELERLANLFTSLNTAIRDVQNTLKLGFEIPKLPGLAPVLKQFEIISTALDALSAEARGEITVQEAVDQMGAIFGQGPVPQRAAGQALGENFPLPGFGGVGPGRDGAAAAAGGMIGAAVAEKLETTLRDPFEDLAGIPRDFSDLLSDADIMRDAEFARAMRERELDIQEDTLGGDGLAGAAERGTQAASRILGQARGRPVEERQLRTMEEQLEVSQSTFDLWSETAPVRIVGSLTG